jgi:hypothetical protein
MKPADMAIVQMASICSPVIPSGAKIVTRKAMKKLAAKPIETRISVLA